MGGGASKPQKKKGQYKKQGANQNKIPTNPYASQKFKNSLKASRAVGSSPRSANDNSSKRKKGGGRKGSLGLLTPADRAAMKHEVDNEDGTEHEKPDGAEQHARHERALHAYRRKKK